MTHITSKLTIGRSCPKCGGDSIKFGTQPQCNALNPRQIMMFQRMKCKVCGRLWYYIIEKYELNDVRVIVEK